MMDYGLFERAHDVLVESGLSTVPIQAALIECLVGMEKRDEAIDTISKFKPPSPSAMADIQTRLTCLGVISDSEDVMDEGLLDDDLVDDDFLEERPISSAPLPTREEEDMDEITKTLEAKAEEFVSSCEFDAAIDVYGQILELNPDHDTALIKIGELMSRAPESPADDLLEDDDFGSMGSLDFTIPNDAFEPTPEPLASVPEPPTSEAPPPSSELKNVDIEPELSSDGQQLLEARARLMVGMHDEVISLLDGADGLPAAIIVAQSHLGKGDYRSARNMLQDAMDDSDEGSSPYKEALWVLAKIYMQQEKYRSVLRTLTELEDLDSSWRSRDILAWKHGLELIR
jgi:tetratricopeptide (TPR) repeat protein